MKPELIGKTMRVVEWAWVFIAVVSVWEVAANWSTDRSQSGLFALFAVGAVVIFVVRRKQRQKFESRHGNKPTE
jgi:hypothetical protein